MRAAGKKKACLVPGASKYLFVSQVFVKNYGEMSTEKCMAFCPPHVDGVDTSVLRLAMISPGGCEVFRLLILQKGTNSLNLFVPPFIFYVS
jgi:hypothetical protein